MVSFEIPATVVLSIHNFLMVCGFTISSNMLRRIMKSPPVTKHPPVSASTKEAATHFKMLQLTCMGPYKRSCVHFEGILSKKKYPVARMGAYG